MSSDFYTPHFNELKSKYPTFQSYIDYKLFTVLCMKYYFFAEENIPFDQDMVDVFLCDGASDGGIDAIFNDPESLDNDIVIMQSKYYVNSPLTADQVVGELAKICETIENLKKNIINIYSEKLVSAYASAENQMSDDAEFKICFFTSFEPKTTAARNKLEKTASKFPYKIEFFFHDDIEKEIELRNQGRICVASDKLEIDHQDNKLHFEESVMVNISAKSLQSLHFRYRNGLFGLNLRYQVKERKIDTAVNHTITQQSGDFWYKNNGIVIVCDSYIFDGKEINLENFSIINGGQTTALLGKCNLPEEDFYLPCKIVKTKGETPEKKGKFVHEIAEATNSQKPIKIADLRANSPEQLALKEKLSKHGIQYVTKRGEKADKRFEISTKMDTVGKVCMAGVLQIPGSARGKPGSMFVDENYRLIFKDTPPSLIADLLKIGSYYDKFVKTQLKGKGFDETSVIPVMRNGKTYQIACFALLAKLQQGVISDDSLGQAMKDPELLKALLRENTNFLQIIVKKLEDEESIVYQIFDDVGEYVLGHCFNSALEKAKDNNDSVAAANYLKTDTTYYKDVIKQLRSRFAKNKELQANIKKMM